MEVKTSGRPAQGLNRAKSDAPPVFRVFHVTDTFVPNIGGIETALATLLPQLSGVASYVLTNSIVGSPAIERFGEHTTVLRIPPRNIVANRLSQTFTSGGSVGRAANSLYLISEWRRQKNRRRIVGRIGPEGVVHFHGLGWLRGCNPRPKVGTWRAKEIFFRRYFRMMQEVGPYLYTDHSLFSGEYARFVGNGGPALVDSVSSVVAVEESGYLNALHYIRESRASTRVDLIPNPVDLNVFAWKAPKPSELFRVGYVGRAAKPGLDLVIRLWESAPDWAELRLCLAGTPIEVANLRRNNRIRALLKRPRVHADWNVAYKDMSSFLSGIDVLVDPYETGTPRTTIETLCTGRPVVRLRKSRDSVEPLLPSSVAPFIPWSDIGLTWDWLQRLRDSPETHTRICGECRAFGASTFDLVTIAAKYEEVYRRIAEY